MGEGVSYCVHSAVPVTGAESQLTRARLQRQASPNIVIALVGNKVSRRLDSLLCLLNGDLMSSST